MDQAPYNHKDPATNAGLPEQFSMRLGDSESPGPQQASVRNHEKRRKQMTAALHIIPHLTCFPLSWDRWWRNRVTNSSGKVTSCNLTSPPPPFSASSGVTCSFHSMSWRNCPSKMFTSRVLTPPTCTNQSLKHQACRKSFAFKGWFPSQGPCLGIVGIALAVNVPSLSPKPLSLQGRPQPQRWNRCRLWAPESSGFGLA